MALIKCPECGKEVSTQADICPHCGYHLKKENIAKIEYPKPKDDDWVGKYKVKKIVTILVLVLLTIIVFFIFRHFLVLEQTDRKEVHIPYVEETIYETKDEWMLLSIVFGFVLLFVGLVTIVSPFSIKMKVYNIEGYSIVLYTGVFKDALVIEDVVVESELDSMFHATYLDGELPNGTKVYARFCWGSMRLETKSFYSK